jgi:hypothetical protein
MDDSFISSMFNRVSSSLIDAADSQISQNYKRNFNSFSMLENALEFLNLSLRVQESNNMKNIKFTA